MNLHGTPIRRSARAAAVFTVALCAACSGPDPSTSGAATGPVTLDRIKAENLAALGGAERLDQLWSMQVVRTEKTIVHRARGRQLVELLDETGNAIFYAEGFDGINAWEQLPDESARRPVTGRPLVALWHTTQFPAPTNPLAYLERAGHVLEYLGTSMIEETEYHHVRVTLTDGFQKDFFINPETWLIERSRDRRRFHAYEEDQKNIEVVWSDFRVVDGVTVAFGVTERDIDTGEVLGSATFLNVALSDEPAPLELFSVDGQSDPAALARLVDAALAEGADM